MSTEALWIDRGKQITDLMPHDMPKDPDVTFRLFGLVHCRPALVYGQQCTIVEWDLDNCHLDCLDTVRTMIRAGTLKAPYLLKIYRLGWFSEFHGSQESACKRIDELGSMRAIKVFPRVQYVSTERDPDCAASQLQQILHGRLKDKLVVSKVERNGNVPLVSVGSNSMLAHITGNAWVETAPCAMEKRFQGFDSWLASTLLEAHASGRPKLHETWALVPQRGEAEPWWLRTHRLLIPAKDDTVISYCMQGEFQSSLRTTFFGHPGREISVAAQV